MTQPTEQDRVDFEAWISKPPFDKDTSRYDADSSWPGSYRLLSVDLAWCAWQEAQAKMQARVAELEAEKWNAQIAEAALLSVEKERDGLEELWGRHQRECSKLKRKACSDEYESRIRADAVREAINAVEQKQNIHISSDGRTYIDVERLEEYANHIEGGA